MSLKIITRETVDGVVVELNGRITLGEGSSSVTDQVQALLAAKKNRIVLDISSVSFIDSAGLGAMVKAFSVVAKAGGRLTLCHPGMKLMDVMSITKLGTVFDLVSSVDEALAEVKSERLMFICSVSGCDTWSPLKTTSVGDYQTCTSCRSQTKLILEQEVKTASRVSIDHIRIPTYRGEYVVVIPGTPRVVKVMGRLDLFALNFVKRAAFTVRRAVFDLTAAQEISERAAQALLDVSAGTSVVFIPDKTAFPPTAIPTWATVYNNREEAIRAHFAAIEEQARQDGREPDYGGNLHTYFLR